MSDTSDARAALAAVLQSNPGIYEQASHAERLLLDQTPIIFPYFYKHMSASKTTVGSIEPTAMGHISLKTAGFKA